MDDRPEGPWQETSMKRLLSNTALAATGLAVLLAAAPAAAKVCLRVQDITSSVPTKDGSAIIFKMNNGKVWRNELGNTCPGLRFNGFAWVIRGSQEVCDNMQSFQVLHSGEVCKLGKFTEVKPKNG
jgi:hypothetical protein